MKIWVKFAFSCLKPSKKKNPLQNPGYAPDPSWMVTTCKLSSSQIILATTAKITHYFMQNIEFYSTSI